MLRKITLASWSAGFWFKPQVCGCLYADSFINSLCISEYHTAQIYILTRLSFLFYQKYCSSINNYHSILYSLLLLKCSSFVLMYVVTGCHVLPSNTFSAIHHRAM